MNDPIVERVERFAADLLPSLGLELVEVQFRKEQQGWVLRVFIDAEDGVSLDHCSQVSRELGDYLDVEDVISHPYNLEISSPGLERKLTKIEDFVRFCGRKAKVKLHQELDGEKTHIGILARVEGQNIVLEREGGSEIEFTFDMVGQARLSL